VRKGSEERKKQQKKKTRIHVFIEKMGGYLTTPSTSGWFNDFKAIPMWLGTLGKEFKI
jgi:hypothetical protein